MKIIIEGNAKEIAAFVLELQERQSRDLIECGTEMNTSEEPAFIPHDSNGINNAGIHQENK